MNKPTRVLIVEDLMADAELAQYEIRRVVENCEFQLVQTRKDYLAALETFQPDLILSDYHLPSFDGMTALKLALEHASLTPLIIWTGSLSEDIAVDCMKAGANNYVLKDNIKRLAPAVLHALDERHLLLERKQAEEKYQAIIEYSLEGIFQSSPEGRYLNVNPAMARIYGYDSPQEMIESVADIASQIYVESDGRHEFTRLIQTQGIVENFERKNYRKDGSVIWTSTSARTVCDADGNILYYEGFLQDITQRKWAEAALTDNEKRFRALIENGLDSISLLSADGTLIWESPSTQRILEYEHNQFLGRNIFELMHPDDLEWTRGLYVKLIQEPGSRQRGAFRLRHSDGTWRWVEAIATNMLDDPSVNAIVINYRDVTERKQAEARINDLLAFNEKILNHSSVGILTYKVTGECVFANENAASIVGASVEELNAQNFRTIEAWKKSGLYDLVERTIATQAHVTSDVHHLSTFGKDVWMTAHCVTFKSKDEDHVLLSISDITERKQVEEALRESENRLVLALSAAQMSVWEWDLHTNNIFWSPEFFGIAGVNKDAFGRTIESFTNLIHSEDVSRVLTSAEKALADKTLFAEEFRIIRPDDEIRWLSNLGQAEYDSSGEHLLLIGTVQDVTERKQAEIERQALLEIMQGLANTKDLQELLKLIHDSIAKVIYATNFFVVFYNKETALFEEIYSVDQYDPPAPPAKLEKSITSYVFRSGEPLLLTQARFNELAALGEVELVGTNSASWLGVPLKTPGGTVGVIAVQDYENPNRYSERDRDFLASIAAQVALAIERKQAEEAVHESEERYRLLIENSGEAILVTQPDGTIQSANPEACRIFGRSEDEIRQLGRTGIVDPKDPRLPSALEERRRTGQFKGELNLLRKDGTVFPAELSTTVFTDSRGDEKTSMIIRDITGRRRAEELLRESEERFSSAFKYASIGMALLTTEGQWFRVNRALCELVGYSEAELTQKTFQDITHPDDLETDLDHVRQLLAGKIDSYQIEKRYFHKLGHVLWVLLSVSLVRDLEGKPLYFISQIQDITERKQAEEALQGSERRYRALFEDTPVAIWEEDFSQVKKHLDFLKGQGITDFRSYFESHPDAVSECAGMISIADVNQAGLQMYQAKTKDDLIKTTKLILSSGELEHIHEDFVAITAGKTSNGWEGADQTLTGEPIEISLSWSVAPGYEDDFSKVIVTTIDITERKRAELELRASEERFLQLAANIQEVFWMTDAESGEEIYMSPAAATLWGRPVADMMQKENAFINSILPEDRPRVLETLEKEKQGAKVEMEYRITRPDGSVRWIWDRAFPILDQAGKVKRIAGISADITERKWAEEKLRESEARYRGLFENLVNGFALHEIVTDEQGEPVDYVFLEINPAFEKLTGINSQQSIGRRVTDVLPGVENDHFIQTYGRVALTGEPVYLEEFSSSLNKYYEINAYSPKRGQFAVTFADITERKLAEREIARHLIELEALYENGLAIGSLLKPSKIGYRIIETFARYLSWHHVAIRLKRSESDELALIAFNQPGLSEDEKASVERHFNTMISKVDEGLSGWVVQTGVPLRTGNVHVHPQYIDTHAGVQSGLYMPLKVGERVIGVISVESEAANAFTEQDERLLATLASQAAIAFENAHLYQTIEEELSERKRVENALRTSETHYRELADSITDVFFELDQNLHYTHWNRASELLTGATAKDVIGKSMQEVFGDTEEQARIEKIYETVLNNHQPRTFETALVLNGQQRAFEINAYPSVRGVSVVAKDVTDRKRSEIIMQKRLELMEFSAHHTLSEVMQRTVDEVSGLTGSTIGFFHFVDSDQINLGTQTWSTNTLRLFNVPVSEGMHLPLDQAGVWAEAAHQRRPLIQNDYGSVPNRKSLSQDHVQILREMVIPILRNEKIVAVMGIGNKPQDYTQQDLEIAGRLADYAWDITERKQMEDALAEERNQLAQRVDERTSDLIRSNSNLARALRVKDEFLANMSHELRTPLNAILGLSESLGEQIAGPLNEKQQKYISTISESGHHLLSLINDILDLAKIEAGQITLDINKVDIQSVCQASLRMIKQLAQKKNQQVLFEIDKGFGLMYADERRLKQMIVNLLSNAVKFTPEGGEIGLKVHGILEENRVMITVWDNGMGIRENDLPQLFRPFVQLDSGLDRGATGTGLGLALVAQMARLHGGSVEAFSRPGIGSRFTIMLPWEPALAADTATRFRTTGKFRAVNPDDTNKPTILLIEDTQEVIMMIADYLELAGYKIVTAQDGIEGIAQARLTHPDLILMDVQMPRMDGLEATRKLRSEPEFKETPIIALTALAMSSDRERCLAAGMDEYMSKPINLKALAKLIQRFLYANEEPKAP